MAWEKIDEQMLTRLEKQKTFEDETAKKLRPLYESASNPFVKLFIHRIILDTKTHSDVYQTLIDINRRVVVGETDRKRMTEELTSHITTEREMLDKAEELNQSVKDESFRKILTQVVEDERRHHHILKELLTIIKKEGKDWNQYMYDMFVGGGIP